MKTSILIIFRIFLVAWAILMAGCEKYLDKLPDDMLTLEMVFEDRQRTEEWLAGTYAWTPDPLKGLLVANGYPYLTDDAQAAFPMGQFWPWSWVIGYIQGSWNPSFTAPINYWNDAYILARRVYIFMDNVKPLPDQGLHIGDVVRMKNEARFQLAYFYSRLLEHYGPFPLVTSAVAAEASAEELNLPRTPYDDIVNYLDQEFLELADFFPAEYQDESFVGRPTKGAVLAVRARMHLFAASPLFNGNPDYLDVKNLDGTPLFSQTYDPTKWRKAADATKDLLALADNGTYDLYKEYHNGNIDPFISFQNLFLVHRGNKEIILANTNTDYANYNAGALPRGLVGYAGYYGATQNLVDAFFMSNGLPIDDPASGYVEQGFTSSAIYYPNTSYNQADPNATPGLVVAPNTYNMYANREPRFYISIRHNDQWIPQANRYTEFKFGEQDGGPTHDSPQCGYLVRKAVQPYADPRAGRVNRQPGIVLRLAEFYLNYAEALNEIEPGNPEILSYVNLIRERAGIPPLGGSVLADQNEMREAIRRERRVEFALENDVRFHDIRRWKIAEQVFSNPIQGLNNSATTDENFYTRRTFMTRQFSKKFYLWPILQEYIDKNPQLVQNKFW